MEYASRRGSETQDYHRTGIPWRRGAGPGRVRRQSGPVYRDGAALLHSIAIAQFDEPPRYADANAPAEMMDHGQIMGNEQIEPGAFFLQPLRHVDDLNLDWQTRRAEIGSSQNMQSVGSGYLPVPVQCRRCHDRRKIRG